MLAVFGAGCATISRASVNDAGVGGDGNVANGFAPAVSGNGRYIAFASAAQNMVPGDTNESFDIFRRDTQTGKTIRVSVTNSGAQSNGFSGYAAAISSDGRYVAFSSDASNLVSADTNHVGDIFVRDTVAGTTTRVSVDSTGTEGNDFSFAHVAISDDGRNVAFTSLASNLVDNDTNGKQDVFVRDVISGTTTRASVDSAGVEGDGASLEPRISSDGRLVVFMSAASNLVDDDANGVRDIFVRDTVDGVTTRASVGESGAEANGRSYDPMVSGDGRYVAFASDASNLVTGDTNDAGDAFVHDTLTGATTRESVNAAGEQADADSSGPSISGDGRYVVFSSSATNLVAGDDYARDEFVRDRVTGTVTRASVDLIGARSDADSDFHPAISRDGRTVAFNSDAHLVSDDVGPVEDVYVRPNPVPTVTGISPSVAPRGIPTAVTITGTGFRADTFPTTSNDVVITNRVVLNETTITATITPKADAAVGAHDVGVVSIGTGGPGFASFVRVGCLNVS